MTKNIRGFLENLVVIFFFFFLNTNVNVSELKFKHDCE